MRKLGFGGVLCGILSLLPLAAATVAVVWLLPETIPVHYGGSGLADRWGSKYECFFLPVFSLVFGGAMLLGAWLAARSSGKNGDQGCRVLVISGIVCLAVFNLLNFFILYAAWAQLEDLGDVPEIGLRILLGVVAVALLILGAVMPQVKQNPWFGVRTKWTLQSETVWVKSQRFGGKLFMAAALLCLLSLLLPFPWVYSGYLLSVGAATAGSVIYARWEGKREQS